MFRLVLFFIFSTVCISIELPSNAVSLDEVVDAAFQVEDNVLTIYIHKKRKGYLSMGLGEDMDQGDIFIIELKKGELEFINCITIGHKNPVCAEDNQTWTLVDSELNDNGTWKAVVSRNMVDETNGLRVSQGINYMMLSYSDDDNHF